MIYPGVEHAERKMDQESHACKGSTVWHHRQHYRISMSCHRISTVCTGARSHTQILCCIKTARNTLHSTLPYVQTHLGCCCMLSSHVLLLLSGEPELHAVSASELALLAAQRALMRLSSSRIWSNVGLHSTGQHSTAQPCCECQARNT